MFHEDILRRAAELLSQGLDRSEIARKLAEEGVDPTDARYAAVEARTAHAWRRYGDADLQELIRLWGIARKASLLRSRGRSPDAVRKRLTRMQRNPPVRLRHKLTSCQKCGRVLRTPFQLRDNVCILRCPGCPGNQYQVAFQGECQ